MNYEMNQLHCTSLGYNNLLVGEASTLGIEPGRTPDRQIQVNSMLTGQNLGFEYYRTMRQGGELIGWEYLPTDDGSGIILHILND